MSIWNFQGMITKMIKKVIFSCNHYYYNYHHYNCYHYYYYYYQNYSIYNTEGKFKLNQRHYVHVHCRKSVSQELICVLNWNFQRMLKGEDHLTKRKYVHAITNTSVTATFTTTSIETTCKGNELILLLLLVLPLSLLILLLVLPILPP